MTASSPLAAMHRPMQTPTWRGRDIFRSHYASNSAPGAMSLREQLHKGTGDFLGVKEVRGSSPAVSLAADLSQNFRLDNEASPKFPTPRRALFTANVVGNTGDNDFVTTPTLLSSSPVQLPEMTPLPRKVTFAAVVEVASPTPIASAANDAAMPDSSAPNSPQSSPVPTRSLSRQSSLEPTKPIASELAPMQARRGRGLADILAGRRIAAPRRTTPIRLKALANSTGSPASSSPSVQITANNSTLSLDECFDLESPQQDRSRPLSSHSPCSPIPIGLRSKSQFGSIGGNSRLGSPGNLHARRQSNPFLRTRKQFRRSLSMFESPTDIMKPKPERGLAASPILKSVTDVQEAHEPIIPHFLPDDPSDTIPRISRETMLEILDGKYGDKFAQRMVIDCRFEYEYDGGHIDGAVNHNNKELLADQLFQMPMDDMTLLIFHCEYSAHRAPLMARHIRSQDRTINAEHYPRLTYPEIYILDGGYSGFFAEHRARCFPPEYVEMSDEKHQRTCEREMGRLKARKPFGRAQTFAFGQRETFLHDSPTGPPRPHSRNANVSSPLSIPDSPIFGERAGTRRMVSY
ncbi:hypothetical protein ACHAPX_005125 [Trichoderma viride]